MNNAKEFQANRDSVRISCPKLSYKAFLENRYKIKVVVGTHPIPKKYLDMHTLLGTWEDKCWKPLVAPTMADEETRARYD